MIASYLFDQYAKVIWPLALMYFVMIWRLVHMFDYRLGGKREERELIILTVIASIQMIVLIL